MIKGIWIAGFLMLLTFIIPVESQAQVVANVEVIDITPPLEMKYPLGGYGERMNKPAEEIHDRIYAKALVIRNKQKKYAVVTLDLLGLPTNVKKDLVKRIADKGWGEENIMMLPSHSHGSLEMAALNSKNQLGIPQIGIYQPELLEFVLDKLESLMLKADRNHVPVLIGSSSRKVTGLNRNRRGDPEVDNEMIVTRIDQLRNKPLAVLVGWPAHPTFIDGVDMKVSAEWPGYLQSELEETIGQEVVAMYYNGAEGDLSPIMDVQADSYEKIQLYGKKVAKEAYSIYQTIKTAGRTDFDFSYKVVQLPEYQVHPDFMKTGGAEYGLTEETAKIVMSMLGPTEVGMGTVRLGDLVIAGIPGEMGAGMGLKVKNKIKALGAKHVAIGGLANEWISYIISRNQYINGGGYESSVSFYGPELGEIIVKEAVQNARPVIKQ